MNISEKLSQELNVGLKQIESTVALINLLISLVLVCAGVFMLNYTHKSKQKLNNVSEVSEE